MKSTNTALTRQDQEDKQQLDLFAIPILDFLLKDEQETMERPFLCISERPTKKSIEYTSPDGDVWIKVYPHPEHGAATIGDWDVIIWCASQIWRFIEEEGALPSRTIRFHPYNLLKSIDRPTGGYEYKRLGKTLDRLQGTQIKTSIRAKDKVGSTFSWINQWRRVEDAETGATKYWELELNKWIYEGIVDKSKVLTLHPDYFTVAANVERWLYRVARKHAGDQVLGFSAKLDTLYEKSGKTRSERQWKCEMRNKRLNNRVILNYSFDLYQNDKGEEVVHMIRADLVRRFQDEKFGVRASMRVLQKGMSDRKSIMTEDMFSDEIKKNEQKQRRRSRKLESDLERYGQLHQTALQTISQK